jgi:hypothetical protein
LNWLFGPNCEEVAGLWRRLHNKELHNLCASPNAITVIKDEIDGACSTHGSDVIGKPEENHSEDPGLHGKIT